MNNKKISFTALSFVLFITFVKSTKGAEERAILGPISTNPSLIARATPLKGSPERADDALTEGTTLGSTSQKILKLPMARTLEGMIACARFPGEGQGRDAPEDKENSTVTVAGIDPRLQVLRDSIIPSQDARAKQDESRQLREAAAALLEASPSDEVSKKTTEDRALTLRAQADQRMAEAKQILAGPLVPLDMSMITTSDCRLKALLPTAIAPFLSLRDLTKGPSHKVAEAASRLIVYQVNQGLTMRSQPIVSLSSLTRFFDDALLRQIYGGKSLTPLLKATYERHQETFDLVQRNIIQIIQDKQKGTLSDADAQRRQQQAYQILEDRKVFSGIFNGSLTDNNRPAANKSLFQAILIINTLRENIATICRGAASEPLEDSVLNLFYSHLDPLIIGPHSLTYSITAEEFLLIMIADPVGGHTTLPIEQRIKGVMGIGGQRTPFAPHLTDEGQEAVRQFLTTLSKDEDHPRRIRGGTAAGGPPPLTSPYPSAAASKGRVVPHQQTRERRGSERGSSCSIM